MSGEAIGLPLQGPESEVNVVAVSRVGNLVLSGSGDGTVRDWDISAQRNVSEKQKLLTLLDEMSCISCVTLSANGKLAFSGSECKVVQKWDTSTGEAVGPSME